MVSFEKLKAYNPQITSTSFAHAERTSFAGGGYSESKANYAHYDTPKNIYSTGVYGTVEGTGYDGAHKLNTYF